MRAPCHFNIQQIQLPWGFESVPMAETHGIFVNSNVPLESQSQKLCENLAGAVLVERWQNKSLFYVYTTCCSIVAAYYCSRYAVNWQHEQKKPWNVFQRERSLRNSSVWKSDVTHTRPLLCMLECVKGLMRLNRFYCTRTLFLSRFCNTSVWI